MKRALLFFYRHDGTMGRLEFLYAELFRGLLLGACYGLYKLGGPLPAAILLPVALWPGIVGTIRRFRDLGHDPIWILPVLTYLSAGFAAGYVMEMQWIGLVTLNVYLAYVLLKPGHRPEHAAAAPKAA